MRVFIDGYNITTIPHGSGPADRAYIVTICPKGVGGPIAYSFLVFATGLLDAAYRLRDNSLATIEKLEKVYREDKTRRLREVIDTINKGSYLVAELTRDRVYAVSYFDDTRSYQEE